MRYGLRVLPEGVDDPSAEQVMAATRDAGFGPEVKRRIILGTYALSSGYYDAYYGSAQKVRALIAQDFAAAYEKVDVLVSPTAPTTAFKLGDKLDDPMAMYLNDIATIPANLAGVPGMSLPVRPRRRGRAAHRHPDPRPGDQGRAAVRRGRRARGGARSTAGAGRCSTSAPELAAGREPEMATMTTADAVIDYDEALTQFDPVMGLEVHVELHTATKMFCGCATAFGAEPNSQVCPVCLGLPGALPVVNEKAVESAIRIGLALNCEIAEWCRFARKNYFYPDMPKNFQTSQYDEPIAFDGWTSTSSWRTATVYRVEIERAHMEEDTGKSLHVGGATGRIHGADHSLVDYNRAGIPLIEIVTKPMAGAGERAPEIARPTSSALRELLRALEVSDVRDGAGFTALRRQRLAAASPGRRAGVGAAGHAHRDQERQLAALGRAGGALRDHAARGDPRRRWPDRAGDAALARGHRRHDRPGARSPTPRTTATSRSPTSCPSRRRARWWRRCAQTLPEPPGERRKRLQTAWGYSDLEMRDVVNAGAVELIEETVAAGATPPGPRSGGAASSPGGPTPQAWTRRVCRGPASRRRTSPSSTGW